jgi:hypothetical protein
MNEPTFHLADVLDFCREYDRTGGRTREPVGWTI